ncbi:unnamed protein product [Lactuca virosa]|uniref:Uncharacterized protein n=1 Tax=Lactuca virosa TaxID=75947 RepID=A0AAU9N2E2_9ASTR|nr:unnamed protein product [Lactuca virosa]
MRSSSIDGIFSNTSKSNFPATAQMPGPGTHHMYGLQLLWCTQFDPISSAILPTQSPSSTGRNEIFLKSLARYTHWKYTDKERSLEASNQRNFFRNWTSFSRQWESCQDLGGTRDQISDMVLIFKYDSIYVRSRSFHISQASDQRKSFRDMQYMKGRKKKQVTRDSWKKVG